MFLVLFVPLLISAFSPPLLAQASTSAIEAASTTDSRAISVPFYSQFTDIQSASWQKRGCGIASLAMVIDYYATSSPSVNKLLSQGISLGAYSPDGWTYAGLIALGKKYGLTGETKILYDESDHAALAELLADAKNGPLIASVHYKFDPKNPIPHLIVVDRIDGDTLYYNDPAAKSGDKKIALNTFLKAWKKRYIILRPHGSAPALS